MRAACPAHLPWIYHSKISGAKVQIMTFIITQFSPAFYHFPPLEYEVKSTFWKCPCLGQLVCNSDCLWKWYMMLLKSAVSILRKILCVQRKGRNAPVLVKGPCHRQTRPSFSDELGLEDHSHLKNQRYLQASLRGTVASELLLAFVLIEAWLQYENVLAEGVEWYAELVAGGWTVEDGYRNRLKARTSTCSSNSLTGSLQRPEDCVPLAFHSQLALLRYTVTTCNKDTNSSKNLHLNGCEQNSVKITSK